MLTERWTYWAVDNGGSEETLETSSGWIIDSGNQI